MVRPARRRDIRSAVRRPGGRRRGPGRHAAGTPEARPVWGRGRGLPRPRGHGARPGHRGDRRSRAAQARCHQSCRRPLTAACRKRHPAPGAVPGLSRGGPVGVPVACGHAPCPMPHVLPARKRSTLLDGPAERPGRRRRRACRAPRPEDGVHRRPHRHRPHPAPGRHRPRRARCSLSVMSVGCGGMAGLCCRDLWESALTSVYWSLTRALAEALVDVLWSSRAVKTNRWIRTTRSDLRFTSRSSLLAAGVAFTRRT